MMNTTDNTTARRKPSEKLQFNLLLAIAFIWFYAFALACRITLRKPEQGCEKESCFQTARRSAYSVVPYAFMSI